MTALFVLGLFLAAADENPCSEATAAPEVLGIWSGLQPGDDGFQNPLGLASDGAGQVFVLDGSRGRVIRFDQAGHAESSWELPLPPGSKKNITATAIAVSGSLIFVHSPPGGGVLVMDPRGSLLDTLPYGCGVNGLAADPLGQFYVSGRHQDPEMGAAEAGDAIWKLNRRGEELAHWPIPVSGALAADPDGSLWGVTRVYEGGPRVLRHWTPFGEVLSDWELTGLVRPEITGIAVDARGHVFLSLRQCHSVAEFDRMGRVIRRWASAGPGERPLSEPSGLMVDRSGHVYVADWARHRIVKYDPETRR